MTNQTNTRIISDDVLIRGRGDTQGSEKNIKLNADRFNPRQKKTAYTGHLLTADGLKIESETVCAIRKTPKLTDVEAVQRLLGMKIT